MNVWLTLRLQAEQVFAILKLTVHNSCHSQLLPALPRESSGLLIAQLRSTCDQRGTLVYIERSLGKIHKTVRTLATIDDTSNHFASSSRSPALSTNCSTPKPLVATRAAGQGPNRLYLNYWVNSEQWSEEIKDPVILVGIGVSNLESRPGQNCKTHTEVSFVLGVVA